MRTRVLAVVASTVMALSAVAFAAEAKPTPKPPAEAAITDVAVTFVRYLPPEDALAGDCLFDAVVTVAHTDPVAVSLEVKVAGRPHYYGEWPFAHLKRQVSRATTQFPAPVGATTNVVFTLNASSGFGKPLGELLDTYTKQVTCPAPGGRKGARPAE